MRGTREGCEEGGKDDVRCTWFFAVFEGKHAHLDTCKSVRSRYKKAVLGWFWEDFGEGLATPATKTCRRGPRQWGLECAKMFHVERIHSVEFISMLTT